MSTTALRTLGAIVVTLALSGCWEQIGHGANHTWSNPGENQLTTANVASLDEAWSVSFQGRVDDEPIVSGGRVIVSEWGTGSDGVATMDVHALRATTGTPAWSTNLFAGTSIFDIRTFDPSIAAGNVWVGFNFATVTGRFESCYSDTMRLDPATGAVVSPEGGFGSTVVEAGRNLVQVRGDLLQQQPAEPPRPPWCGVGGTPATLVVRDRETLATKWTAPDQAASGPPVGLLGALGPTVAGDKVVLATMGAVRAYALDGCGAATCEPVWTMPLPVGEVGVVGAPVAGPDDQLFVVLVHASPFRTELVSLSRATGAVNWTAHLSDTLDTDVRLATAGDRLYVSGGRVFDAGGCGAATCAPLWTVTPAGGAAGPVVAGGVVYEAGPGEIHAYDAAGCGAATCAALVEVPVDGTPTALSVSDGHLYVTNGTELTAYAP
jgi:hypothetical protein